MAWRDQLRPGSFRDAAFLIDAGETEVGRRTARHEYPQRDLPYLEDLGRRAREYRIDAVVLGADYMAARDALIEAVEQPGPGTLVHPYLGSLSVVCTGCRLRESTAEGGLAAFTLTFVEAGENAYPAGEQNGAAGIAAAGIVAETAVTDSFEDGFAVEGWPGFVAADAEAMVGAGVASLDLLARQLSGAGAALTAWRASADGVIAQAAELIRAPRALAGATLDLLSALGALDPAAGRSAPPAGGQTVAKPPVLRLYDGLGAYGASLGLPGDPAADILTRLEEDARPAPLPTLATPSRRRQADNRRALAALIRRGAALEAARTVPVLRFDSYDDAVRQRDRLAGRLDAAAADAGDLGDDGAWRALSDLRRAVVRDITRRGGSLARIRHYLPTATEPALVAAYRLHGTALRAEEIVARNRIRHPGFLPGGARLEVLSDG